jgi:prepilin-type N-terminal cleavage/methylation domain-containing protein/prepilin-type processing-associated H-X9-DG protein
MKRVTLKLSRRGFSLIEMLVVIGIIAILAALIINAASKGLQRGKSVSCTANLRQLYMLTQGYVDDNGKYPLMGLQEYDDSGTIRNIADDIFYTHFGDEPVTACPSAKFKGKNHEGKPIKSYGSNPMMMNYSRADGIRAQVKASQVDRPADVVLLADSPQFSSGARRVLPYSMAWWPSPFSGVKSQAEEPLTEDIIPESGFWDDIPLMPRRHLGQANLVLTDGHAGAIRATSELRQKNYYWNY